MELVIRNASLQFCSLIQTCDALYNLVPFVQFKKCEKHPWRSLTFSKLSGERPATLLKATLLQRCFSRFWNCTNATKSRKTNKYK